MSQSILQRRLVDVSERLKRLRSELAVTDEQVAFLEDEADEARLRALVAETPIGDIEARDARRHADARSPPRHARRVGRRARARAGRVARPDGGRALHPLITPEPRSAPVPDPTRVVIAEDEAIIRLDLKELLEEEGYEVVGETGRGDEAIELVRQNEPDLVILDIKMPGMDGLTAARHITSERLAAVLVLTAFSQRDLVEQARDAGALAYLVKPFQKSDLIPAIEMALGRYAELASLERDVGNLAERLEERKTIDRAKGVLMDQHGTTEREAWRFLQQQAMHNRVKVHDIARRVVDGELTP
jgi:AmiR/NasT family two-component response regulator